MSWDPFGGSSFDCDFKNGKGRHIVPIVDCKAGVRYVFIMYLSNGTAIWAPIPDGASDQDIWRIRQEELTNPCSFLSP